MMTTQEIPLRPKFLLKNNTIEINSKQVRNVATEVVMSQLEMK